MRLRQASSINPVSELVISQFEQNAPIFNDIDAYVRGGNSDSLKKEREGIAQSSIFRDINNHTNRAAPEIDYLTIPKKIVTGDSRIDKVYEQRNMDPMEELEKQTRIDAQKDAKAFHEKAWLGDSATDSSEFDGIANQIPAGRTEDLTEALILPIGGDASKAQQQKFFETFMEMQAVMPFDRFNAYLNERFKWRIITAAKNLGYYSNIQTPDGEADVIGKAVIKSFGYKADGTLLFPFDETVGGHTKTSPAIFTRWGEGVDLTFVTSAGIVADYLGIVDTKFYSNGWDLDGAFGLQNENAVYRFNGLALEEDGA